MKRVIYYILLALLLSAPAQAQGWRGSVNGQELFSGAAARPQINNGPTLGTSSYFWLALYVKNINFGTGGVLKLPDGTGIAPSLTFTSNADRGLFNDTASSGIGFSVGGSRTAFLNSTAFKTTGASTYIDASQTALAVTSQDGLVAENTTAATVGVQVQFSPRLRLSGTAWNSVGAVSEIDSWIMEMQPTGAAGATSAALVLSRSIAGGAYSERMRWTSAGSQIVTSLANIGWNSQTLLSSPVDGQLNISNQAAAAGIGFDVSTDSTVKIRTRAQTGYGTLDTGTESFYGIPSITFVTTDFTTANNTNFQAITGLAWTFPVTTAINIPFRCSLYYSQATAAVSDSFGVQAVTVAPSNAQIGGSMETALGTTAYGDLTLTSTTASAVVTGTPSATGTIFNAYMDGLIEQPSNASTSSFQVQVKTTVGADAITIKRGSYCKIG